MKICVPRASLVKTGALTPPTSLPTTLTGFQKASSNLHECS